MTRKTFDSLPADVLIHIAHYLDQRSQLELGTVSKSISHISIKQLWHTPICTSIAALKSFMHTYNSASTNAYPYHTWLVGLNISFSSAQSLTDYAKLELDNSSCMVLRTLRLCNIQANLEICNSLLGVLIQQRLKEIDISNCYTDMAFSFAAQLGQLNCNQNSVSKISIQDCYMTDSLVQQITAVTPKLRYFSSQRSGYISDTAIIAITQNCPLIETLIVTLPKYIIQSNTITSASLEALGNCKHLKKLVCRGQIRIASQESKKRLFRHCPLLEHCDLSF